MTVTQQLLTPPFYSDDRKRQTRGETAPFLSKDSCTKRVQQDLTVAWLSMKLDPLTTAAPR